ncbi:Unconventional myosin-X, partial [Desmophyllum pertusum]
MLRLAFDKLDSRSTTTESDADQVYRTNPVLKHSKIPLKAPLLPLPYGQSQSSRAKGKGYGSISRRGCSSFQFLYSNKSPIADPIPVIQGILQTCQDLKTSKEMRYWFVCVVHLFPNEKVPTILKISLERNSSQKHPLTQKWPSFAVFALECNQENIDPGPGRRELSAVVHCYGGGSCKITINSATTAGEVVEKLCNGLNIPQYKALGLTEAGHSWKLFFKIFCFLQPELVEVDCVEYGFLYEQ